MKYKVIVLIGLCLVLVPLLRALPATSDAPERTSPVTVSPGSGSPATIQPLDAIERTPEMKRLQAELEAVTATGDPARIKAVHNRIQAVYLAGQPRPVSGIKAEAVLEPPQGMRDPGPDVLIAGGPTTTSAAAYTMDGNMYAAASLPDSTARVFRSTDHGSTWHFLRHPDHAQYHLAQGRPGRDHRRFGQGLPVRHPSGPGRQRHARPVRY